MEQPTIFAFFARAMGHTRTSHPRQPVMIYAAPKA
jgi:hypothetical protein